MKQRNITTYLSIKICNFKDIGRCFKTGYQHLDREAPCFDKKKKISAKECTHKQSKFFNTTPMNNLNLLCLKLSTQYLCFENFFEKIL